MFTFRREWGDGKMEKKRIIPVLISILFIYAGLFFMYIGTSQLMNERSTKTMPDPQTIKAEKGMLGATLIERNEPIAVSQEVTPVSNEIPPQDENHSETKTNKQNTQALTNDEVRLIVHERIQTLFSTLQNLGEQYGWDFQNPGDYSTIKQELSTQVSEEFANNELKILAEHYYCNCDISFHPYYQGKVGFSSEQLSENHIKAYVLEPANGLENMGYIWTIDLLYECGTWKMHKMSAQSVEGMDLQLTVEDAKEIIAYEYQGEATFIKEYNSKEAGGKAYLFKVVTPYMEFHVAISAKDTRFVEDFSL